MPLILTSAASLTLCRLLLLGQSLLFAALIADFGESSGQTALPFSLAFAIYAGSCVFVGLACSLFGPQAVMRAGTVALALGLLATTAAPSFAILVAAYGVLVGLGTAMLGLVPTVDLVSRRFPRSYGLHLGLMIGIASALVVALTPAIQAGVTAIGWRWTYRIIALAALALLAALVVVDSSGPERSLTLRTVRLRNLLPAAGDGRRPFAALAATYAFMGWYAGSVTVHVVSHAEESGYSSTAAAVGLTVLLGMSAIGSLVAGWVSIGLQRVTVYTISGALKLAGVTMLLVLQPPYFWPLALFAVAFGLGHGLGLTMENAAIADLFPPAQLAPALGALEAVAGVAAASGAAATGFLRDATGTYDVGLRLLVVPIVLSVVAYWIAAPQREARRLAA